MGTSRHVATIASIASRIRKVGLVSWGFLVGCAYTGFIVGLGQLH